MLDVLVELLVESCLEGAVHIVSHRGKFARIIQILAALCLLAFVLFEVIIMLGLTLLCGKLWMEHEGITALILCAVTIMLWIAWIKGLMKYVHKFRTRIQEVD